MACSSGTTCADGESGRLGAGAPVVGATPSAGRLTSGPASAPTPRNACTEMLTSGTDSVGASDADSSTVSASIPVSAADAVSAAG